MQTINHSPRLEDELAAIGFVAGPPPHIAPAMVDVDRRVGRAMKCGACHRRGMKFRPMHKGEVYRVVLACSCGNREEL